MPQRVPFTGEEKESLKVALDRHRDAILWKLEGLSDTDLRKVFAVGTSLLGLVAAGGGRVLVLRDGRETEPLPLVDEDPDADLRVEPGETTENILVFYGRARAAADQVIGEVALEDTGTAWFGDAVSMRWVLIHMVENGRHAGHVDILRELIDGMVGDTGLTDPLSGPEGSLCDTCAHHGEGSVWEGAAMDREGQTATAGAPLAEQLGRVGLWTRQLDIQPTDQLGPRSPSWRSWAGARCGPGRSSAGRR